MFLCVLGFFLQICFVVKLPTEILWTWELRIEIDECLASPVPIIDSDCVQMESFNFFFFLFSTNFYIHWELLPIIGSEGHKFYSSYEGRRKMRTAVALRKDCNS